MPSEVTNYFYTIIVMGTIAFMVTGAFNTHAAGLQITAETRGLKTLLESVAAEGAELAALTEATGATTKVSMKLPVVIGEKYFWLRLRSDNSGAWIEGAFGAPWTRDPQYAVEIPGIVSASGTYKGGYGTLSLNCTDQGAGPVLTLGRWEDD
jgi:hypothetical protein